MYITYHSGLGGGWSVCVTPLKNKVLPRGGDTGRAGGERGQPAQGGSVVLQEGSTPRPLQARAGHSLKKLPKLPNDAIWCQNK